MPSCSVTSEKVISCVPEAAGATQQVACSAVIGVPSANVVAPAIAAKDRHNTTMPAASRASRRPIDLVLIPILPLLYQALPAHVRNCTTWVRRANRPHGHLSRPCRTSSYAKWLLLRENFLELRARELRRISLPRAQVNRTWVREASLVA